MTESIEEVIFPAIGLVFLLLGIVLLASILFSAFNPYDQIAFINAEKLRAKIDEACITNSEVVMNSFELRQNTPVFTWAFTILPRWLIRSGGDPNYVLYYEAFPPGEGAGWEVYHDLQSRLIAPVPDDFLKSKSPQYAAQSVVEYVDDAKNAYERAAGGKVDAVIISNIILSEDFRADYRMDRKRSESFTPGGGGFGGAGPSGSWEGGPAGDEEPTRSEEKFFSYGKWKGQDEDSKIPDAGDNQFVFSNYMSLSPLEKTAIKYMPCGVNSLCLKTRSAVYSFPLRQCNDIKGVQVVYDARNRKDVYEGVFTAVGIVISGGGTAIVKAGSIVSKIIKFVPKSIKLIAGGVAIEEGVRILLNAFLAYKESDLAISSPCEIIAADASGTIKIKEGMCDDICSNVISYPIYEYDTETGILANAKLSDGKNAYHYVCVEKANDKISSPAPQSYGPGDKCVQIRIENIKAKDYCWTLDPTGAGGFWNLDTRIVAGIMGTSPVADSLSYLDVDVGSGKSPALVLLPSRNEGLEGFFKNWEKKLSWGWPGTT